MNAGSPYASPRTPRGGRFTSNVGFPFPPETASDDEDGLLEDEADVIEGSKTSYGQEWTAAGLTPLDETLEKIGMGRYQKSLLILCGFGWMADNCIAVILPRVQEHYGVSDRWIGLLSASIFGGMMVGAWGWGSYSDAQGRIPAFNLTLLLTSIFGTFCAFAPSFFWLCFGLFWLGTGVGGSMPTDGTLFLENIPKTNHYLLTALSAFFSLGAVLTSILGLILIPLYSCPEHPVDDAVCDVNTENLGWRYMLGALSVVSITMFLARIALFRLEESAKFLVTSGRSNEAIIALERISQINGDPMEWVLADVIDEFPSEGLNTRENGQAHSSWQTGEEPRSASSERSAIIREQEEGSPVYSAAESRHGDHRSSLIERRRRGWSGEKSWLDNLPPNLAEGVREYRERVDELMAPRWIRTTTLVWTIWGLASAGYTIFNVFLPKYLEAKVGESAGSGGRKQSLREYVLYTVSGLPGSILGAYLIETSLGRIKTMVISTVATSLGTFIFVMVSSQAEVILSSMLVSLAATLMYAVIYGYTPEAFPVATRGTACGIASAMSRLAGIIAPIVTGLLLSISVHLPLFVSAGCFAVTAACMAALPLETRGRGGPRMAGH